MTPEFKVDFEREARIGLDEALFCESETVDQILAIVDAVKAKTGRMLLTRLDQSKYEALARAIAPIWNMIPSLAPPFAALMRRSTQGRWRSSWPELRSPVSREAARTLAFAGQPYREFTSASRGFWLLLEKIEDIRLSPVVIVAAHGRGPGQRRWRSGFQPGDRVANVRRLCVALGGVGAGTPRWLAARPEYRSSISTMAMARLVRPWEYRDFCRRRRPRSIGLPTGPLSLLRHRPRHCQCPQGRGGSSQVSTRRYLRSPACSFGT